jgi:TonB-linked SusC/RagA family outer membrane protein
MKHKILYTLLAWCVSLGLAFAQGRAVSGTVTDADSGEGVPGVSVFLKGTTTGTTTDVNGKYELSVPNPSGDVLVFQLVGYGTREITLTADAVVDVKLATDAGTLGEVVVVGYGTQDKRSLTGSITSIKGADISNLATASFDQQLGSRVAGVQVTVGNGVMGAAPRIRIRGQNTISGGGSPLIVIDNVPMISGAVNGFNNALADLNPSDIESYEVLKDGSATAIYGSRAANGVILITTKRGKKGKTKVSYDTWIATSSAAKRFDLLNAEEFVTINNEKVRWNNPNAAAQFAMRPDGQSFDWQDEVFRNGFQQNHNVSFTGGTDNTSFFFSGGYTSLEGHVVANNMKRFSFRGNIDQKINKYLNAGLSLGLTKTENVGLNSGRNNLSGNIFAATRMYPNVEPLNPDHPTGYNIEPGANALAKGVNSATIENNVPNIAFVLANNKQTSTNYRVLGNAYAEVVIPQVEGLKLRTQYAVDVLNNRGFSYLDPRHGDGFSGGGSVTESNSDITRWNWQNTISYDRLFNQSHRVNVVVGNEYQSQVSRGFSANASALSSGFFGENGIVSGTFTTPTATGSLTPTGFDSFFGRVSYGFKDKYLASLSVRNDGLSSLPKETRRGTFVGGSLGWRITGEEFFKNIEALSFINDFKIRGSYAEVGNDDIGAFPYLSLLGSAQYGSQNGVSLGINGLIGNPALKWEKSAKTNFGVDLAFLDSRFAVTFDYYRNNVSQLVLQTPTPPSAGVPGNTIAQNVGALYNQGIELRVIAKVIDDKGDNNKFSWTVDANLTTNKNQITELYNGQDILFNNNINRVGNPVGALFGVQFEGVNSANGNPIYRKIDGSLVQLNINNNTYVAYNPNEPTNITTAATFSPAAERVLLGRTNPAWFGGISNTLRFKGFDFEVFVRYSGGNKIMNITRADLLTLGRTNNGTEILERWTTPGQVTNIPRLRFQNDNFSYLAGLTNSQFVEKGDFFRVQNITLGYSLPQSVMKTLNISRLRVYAQVQNAFTFTKYKGLDPEINANGDTNSQFGIDYNTNPLARIFTFGLNVGF